MFHQLHRGSDGVYFGWQVRNTVRATIHFTSIGDGLWRSPARGTFAGYDTDPTLTLEELATFHDVVEARLRARGATRIEILPAPMAHHPAAVSNQLYLLRARGFEIAGCDLNHTIAVDDTRLADRMAYNNLKRLRKCEREGIVGQRLNATMLDAVYATIAENRASKGYPMSMTFDQLQQMVELFPDAVQLFGASSAERLSAAAICLRVSPSVLYAFCWGDRPEFGDSSPVVPVAAAIYQYCQEQQIEILDAGTSTIDREPNHGLIRFKRGLGFEESLKFRLVKHL